MSEIKQVLQAARDVVDACAGENRPHSGWARQVRDQIDTALYSAAVAEREPVLWADPQAVSDTSRSKHGSYTLPLYLDPPPTSELEAENARLRDRVAELDKALEPFAEIAGEAWADGSGWTNAACQNDRICDWFGPSAFHAARRVREGGKVDD